MAIATYSELVQAVKDHLVGHLLTDANVADFIALSESDFNRNLRLRQMIVRSTASIDTPYVTLPGDFLAPHNVTIQGDNGRPLRAISMDAADIDRVQRRGAQPSFYVISGQQMELVPNPTSAVDVELVYYQRIPALGLSNQTNWLITRTPDLYLYMTLGHAASFIVDAQRQQLWRAEALRIIAEMMADDKKARRSGPILTRSRMYSGADRYRI